MWILYEVLLLIGVLFYLPRAFWRRRLPHAGWTMRLGRYPTRIAESLRGRRALWVHAVSVGEVQAATPLLRALEQAYPEAPLVLSSITPGGLELAVKSVGDRGAAFYFPLDVRVCVARALDAIRPRILLLMESELWPTVIRLTKAQGCPIAVVNGRISARAFARYRWVRPWLPGVLNYVDCFLMQGQADADRILALGAPPERVHVVGSLKWDASLGSRPSLQAIQETVTRLGVGVSDVVLVAGSTHRGEERIVVQAFKALRAVHQQARLILAPRHLERLPEVERLVREAGWRAIRVSQDSRPAPWDIALVDVFGQLPRYYSLATVVFIGGSLIPHGGQNPLEAASLGRPIIFGPFMDNFAEITHLLLAHHAARQVARAEELVPLLRELLDHPAQAEALGRRAQELTQHFQGATHRSLAFLAPLLTAPSSTT